MSTSRQMKRLTQADQIRQRGESQIRFYVGIARDWNREALRYLSSRYGGGQDMPLFARYEAMRDESMKAARAIRFVLTGKESLTEQRRQAKRWADSRKPGGSLP